MLTILGDFFREGEGLRKTFLGRALGKNFGGKNLNLFSSVL